MNTCKKNKKVIFLMVSFLSLFLVNCSKDDSLINKNATNYGAVTKTEGVVASVVLNAPLMASQSVSEGLNPKFTYTITLNKVQSVDLHFNIAKVSGTAGDLDYKMDTEIIIPAFQSSATGTIEILKDDLKEPTETLTIQIGDSSTSNATIVTKTVSFSIVNYLSTSLDFVFNYDMPFSITSGAAYTLYDIGYDIDFYIVDASFMDTGIYDAAQTSNTELVSINSSAATTLADGTYHIVYDLFAARNLNLVAHTQFNIPVTVDYFRAGGITSASVVQESAFFLHSKRAAGFILPGALGNYVISFKILNGVYTIFNSTNQTIASGKMMNMNSSINNAINHARLNNRKLSNTNSFSF